MTDATARTVANVAIGSVCAAAAFVVITTPPLRRLAFRAASVWLGASVPVYLMTQVRQAWAESAPRPDIMAR